MPRSLLAGTIGIRADRGVTKKSHLPAVQMLTGLELPATTNNSLAAAENSTRAFDAAAYADGAALSLKVA